MTPLGKGLVLLLGVPAVMGIGFFYYFSATGEDRMRAVCGEVKPGMTTAQLVSFARERNFRPPANEGVTFFADSRSYGRHSCRIDLQAGVVQSATYSYAD
jgi:hypothetical protein